MTTTTNFLRLTKVVINTAHIRKIKIKPDKYWIYTTVDNFDGFFIFGSGGLGKENDIYEVCKKENTADYEKVALFIDNCAGSL